MLENVLFFYYILKIAMSTRRCVIIIHQISTFVILLDEVSLYYLAIFVSGGARFGFVPQRRVPSQRY